MDKITEIQHILLRIVQAEASLASLDASSTESYGIQSAILQHLQEFTCHYLKSNHTQQRSVLMHFMRSVTRIFNWLASRDAARADKDVHLVLNSMEQVLKAVLHASAGAQSMPAQHALQQDISACALELAELSFPMVLVLEKVRSKAAGGSFGAAQEELTEHALRAFYAILQLVQLSPKTAISSYIEKIKPLWPQIAFVKVALCPQPARSICLLCLQTLNSFLNIMNDQTSFMRSVFPGIFSTTYQICMTGQKRGSPCVYEALKCMLLLIRYTSDEESSSNQQLLGTLASSDTPLSSSIGSSSSSTVFNEFLRKRQLASSSSLAQELSSDDAIDEFASMEEFRQFRIQLLQRISSHFPVAFKSACTMMSSKHQAVVATLLALSLRNSYRFLGLQATQELLLCLLSTVAMSNVSHNDVQLQVAELLDVIKKKQPTMFVQLVNHLQEVFSSSFDSISGMLTSSSHALLAQQLRMMISIGRMLPDALSTTLLTSHKQIVQMLVQMFLPDLDNHLKYSALEHHRYFHQSSQQCCNVGYYHIAFANIRDKECLALIRTLAMMLGGYGVANSLCDEFANRIDKLYRRISSSIADDETSSNMFFAKSKLDITHCIALARIVRSALFASNSYSITAIQHANDSTNKCAACGKEEGRLRCSRCKGVVYCSAQHQQQHWKAHKTQCKPHDEASNHAAPQEQQEVVSTERIIDPYDLLHDNTIRIASTISQHQYEQNLFTEQIHKLLEIYSISKQQQRTRALLPCIHALLAVYVECVADVAYLHYHDQGSHPAQHIQDLCVLLQLVVQEDKVLHTAVSSSLQRIALYSGYASVANMLRSQMDYITDFLCTSLKALAFNAKEVIRSLDDVPVHLVIQYVFVTCSITLTDSNDESPQLAPMYLLQDVISDALQLIDQQSTSSQPLYRHELADVVKVLLVFTLAIPLSQPGKGRGHAGGLKEIAHVFHDDKTQQHVLQQAGDESSQQSQDIAKEVIDSLIAFDKSILAFYAPALASDINSEQDRDAIDEADADADDDFDQPLDESTKLLLDIIQRSIYLLNSPVLAIQQTVLTVVANAMLRLSGKLKYLLPCIYKTWGPLCSKLDTLCSLYISAYQREGKSQQTLQRLELQAEQKLPVTLLLTTASQSSSKEISTESSTNSHPVGTHRLLYVLPSLLDVLTLISSLNPQFVSSKLQDDCLPKLIQTLFSFQQQYVHSSMHNSTAQTTAHSVDSKLKQSMLIFLQNLLLEPLLHSLCKRYHKLWLWLLLPFLSSQEVDRVQEHAKKVFTWLSNFEPNFSSAILGTISAGRKQETTSMHTWMVLGLDTQLFSSYQSYQHAMNSSNSSHTKSKSKSKSQSLFGHSKEYTHLISQLLHAYQQDKGVLAFADRSHQVVLHNEAGILERCSVRHAVLSAQLKKRAHL